MTRRVEVIALEEGWLVKAWARSESEAAALQAAAIAVPKAEPVTPPAPEPVVSQPPNCDGFAAEILIERTEGDE